MMTITMFVFSGRVNPTEVVADPASEAAIVAAFEDLVKTGRVRTDTAAIRKSTETLEGARLGYRGIKVEVHGKALVVYDELVTAIGAGSMGLFDDPGRGVEKMLLGMINDPVAATTLSEIK